MGVILVHTCGWWRVQHASLAKQLTPFVSIRPLPCLTDDRPTLSELKLLKLPDGRQVTIIKSLCPRWYDFGIGFEFDDIGDQLDQIRAEFIVHGPVMCCTEMFKCWLGGMGRQPISWRTLLELMEEQRENRLRGQILAALEISDP